MVIDFDRIIISWLITSFVRRRNSVRKWTEKRCRGERGEGNGNKKEKSESGSCFLFFPFLHSQLKRR